MFYLTGFWLLLLASFLFGLILIAIGTILLLKARNKIAGILVGVAGVAFALLCPLAGLMYYMVIVRIQG
ncbi:MAG TPA: hypothetical protein VK206_25795 [Anaerolineales bacterium]|nr:hypothetical protein [Anaerolineales bacterium]